METTLYEVSFDDGRLFKVFCANRSQRQRFLKTMGQVTSSQWRVLENGMHTIKQWEEIIKEE